MPRVMPHKRGATFFRRQIWLGKGRGVESVVHELLEGATAAVDSVVSKLPKNFPKEIASSIEAGSKNDFDF